MTRDVAPRMKLRKPALIHSRFFPGLQVIDTLIHVIHVIHALLPRLLTLTRLLVHKSEISHANNAAVAILSLRSMQHLSCLVALRNHLIDMLLHTSHAEPFRYFTCVRMSPHI